MCPVQGRTPLLGAHPISEDDQAMQTKINWAAIGRRMQIARLAN
jgi:hypothetical protein